MAADYALHMVMAGDDLNKGVAVEKPHAVHQPKARQKRRVMHENHDAPLALGFELAVEPREALGRKMALRLARNVGVETDQLERPALHHIIQRPRRGKIAMLGKGRAKLLAAVMIAGQQIDGHLDP